LRTDHQTSLCLQCWGLFVGCWRLEPADGGQAGTPSQRGGRNARLIVALIAPHQRPAMTTSGRHQTQHTHARHAEFRRQEAADGLGCLCDGVHPPDSPPCADPFWNLHGKALWGLFVSSWVRVKTWKRSLRKLAGMRVTLRKRPNTSRHIMCILVHNSDRIPPGCLQLVHHHHCAHTSARASAGC
jgi:hypothetical protein